MKRIPFYIFLFLFSLGQFACQPKQKAAKELTSAIPDRPDFNFHIRPILSDRCFACHGPDEKARKGNLRLDLKADAFALVDSSENRYAIVAGDLEKSHLWHRIKSKDPEVMMPPPESNLKLSEREIKILEKWIAQGAEWKAHWAFIPPQKITPPAIKNKDAATNPIDQFILKQLEQKGLSPNASASREKQIRRLSFDLRGIPPTLEEIKSFVENDSPDAYETLVNQFINQKSFGERMALDWMDLARYADSHGYQDDLERSMWPWRDWVIEAFNKNMPYDQFVSWQLAGDLLPEATYEQKLATGFNRNHKITQEVGVIDEEYRVTYVLDRVNTFSTAFLGLTIECAQCHDHKYDPFSQKEYYELFSFFNNVPERGRVDYNVEVATPSLALPDEKVKDLKTYIDTLLERQNHKIEQYIAKEWETNWQLKEQANSQQNSPLPNGLKLYYPLDYVEEDQTLEVINQHKALVTNDLPKVMGKFSGALEFTGKNYIHHKSLNSFNFNRPFSLSFWIKSMDGGIRGTVLATASEKELPPGFSLRVTNDKNLFFQLNNNGNNTHLNVLSKETIPPNQWVHIGLSYDGSKRAKGVKMYLNGKALNNYILQNKLRGSINTSKQLYIGTTSPEQLKYRGMIAGQLDEIMLFDRALSEKEMKDLQFYNPLTALIAKEQKSLIDKKRLFHHYLFHQQPNYLALTERFKEYKIREGRMEDIVLQPTMVMEDTDTSRATYILDRGQYDAPTQRVNSATPKAILAFDMDLPKNRLGLSQWLFDSKNPLTARVAVNYFWKNIFGKGLVSTQGDFGSQGSLPSHPELLDWLAIEFRESGWDVKKLIKLMVLSSTYRQDAYSKAELIALDPDNILLARGPQMRLSAEMIRDHALSISGLLSQKIGGPSVKPYQPKGLWLEVASGNQSLRKYIQDHNQDLYRKSLYTFWKRTIPPPAMTIFDAPSREQCIIQRQATSTPMQALVLLNDPQFTEASKLLAFRMLKEGGESVENRIEFAFQLATSRQPKTTEIQVLKDLLQAEKQNFDQQPTKAKQYLAIGEYELPADLPSVELAAYTIVASTILNLTESIQKG